MALLNLNDIYLQKGQEFLDNLFKYDVIIYEKLSGTDFSFEIDDNDNFNFYKKNSNIPITKIDRLLSKVYEDAINYFESLPLDIKNSLPRNTIFGFEYFPNNSPNIITYENLPKNKLILMYVKTNRIGTEVDILKNYANILNVGEPPILFQGKINDTQKVNIIEFLKLTPDEYKKIHKDKSFTEVLLSIIDPKLTKTTLNNDLKRMIEGLVFSFDNGNYKAYAKVINPLFIEILNRNKELEKDDMYNIIISDMIYYVEKIRDVWSEYKFKKVSFEDRYIEIICKIYNRFIKDNNIKYKDVIIYLPKYLQAKEFSINLDLIDDKKTLEYIQIHERYAELFKIMLALFRKKKKKLPDFVSNEILKYQNYLVDDIINKVKEGNESSFPSFKEFYAIYGDEIEFEYDNNLIEHIESNITEGIIENDNNENSIYNINESGGNNGIISFWQEAFTNDDKKDESKLKDIVVFIGKFQPFSNKHQLILNNLTKNKKKLILVQVNNNSESGIYPFNKDLSLQYLNKIKESNKYIEDLLILNEFSLSYLINYLKEKKLKIGTIICNESFKNLILKQFDYLKVFNRDIKFDINMYEKSTDLKSNSEKIIDAIKSDNYLEFKKLVPNDLLIFYNNFKSSLN